MDEYETLEEFGGVEILRTPTCYSVIFPVDTTGDGFADDREVETFDTEEEAREYAARIWQR